MRMWSGCSLTSYQHLNTQKLETGGAAGEGEEPSLLPSQYVGGPVGANPGTFPGARVQLGRVWLLQQLHTAVHRAPSPRPRDTPRQTSSCTTEQTAARLRAVGSHTVNSTTQWKQTQNQSRLQENLQTRGN